jgi:hypothetical protein
LNINRRFGGEIFPRNIGWLLMDYMAVYHRG